MSNTVPQEAYLIACSDVETAQREADRLRRTLESILAIAKSGAAPSIDSIVVLASSALSSPEPWKRKG